MKAAMAGGKGKKKKWSKGKVKEKLANLVLFDKTTYEKMLTDVPKQKLITPSIISEKLKVNGSLARKAVRELVSQGLIRKWRAAPKHRPRPRPAVASSHHSLPRLCHSAGPVLTHKHQSIYTRSTNT